MVRDRHRGRDRKGSEIDRLQGREPKTNRQTDRQMERVIQLRKVSFNINCYFLKKQRMLLIIHKDALSQSCAGSRLKANSLSLRQFSISGCGQSQSCEQDSM